ncbi:OmpA family protein [Rhodothalassium salexigens DSM 2132]|uniref:OmpA family protein n=1 Tax=Rhodothalassium salexigens DSM 2132 TaxID=1188247 RepID=A0A4R2PQG3_RHOSA|nr:Ig-like domain-containing protein [Rhodothalassium salexigens]MBB4211007.1 outer membrane protein OmpA-like peptidoglycan-associated protein/opacity protein-like surface antigen [Rhodothalassium salexigens DSM 2132]TCP36335.1 OmpA family protein [Rhodothalassium salexigens DSM 2132]
MTSRGALLLSAAALALGPAALAQETEVDRDNGPYIGVIGGVNVQTDETFVGQDSNFLARPNADAGYMIGGVFGREVDLFGQGVRFEAEFSYRDNDLDSLLVSQGAGVLGAGDRNLVSATTKTVSVMGNALYSPDIDFPVQPFVGGGIGVSVVDYDSMRLSSQSQAILDDDQDARFAMQGIAGLESYLTDHLRLQVGYRYHVVPNVRLSLRNAGSVKTDYEAHTAFVGLQWQFGGGTTKPAPKPAAAPVAPNRAPTAVDDRVSGKAGQDIVIAVLGNDRDPDGDRLSITSTGAADHGQVRRNPDGTITYRAPADFEGSDRFTYRIVDSAGEGATGTVRLDIAPADLPPPFLVFFALDSAELSASARDTLAEAVDAYRDYGVASISATGHTDTTGPAWYNDRLAKRRADAVKAALEAMGLDAGEIAVAGRGESELLVPTADGVLEPQNRRVEIELRRTDDAMN